MIPIASQPEPLNFDALVRQPGIGFLTSVPAPTTKEWENKEYWRKALPDMRLAYNSICAYCAHWIPHSTGNHSIDHFVPRLQSPQLAYEWSNFRYVAARFNSRKSTRMIIDPFTVQPDQFTIDFNTMLIQPNANLSPVQYRETLETIVILHLNSDDDLITERAAWFRDYSNGEISFAHLQRMAPFVAYEIRRQGI